MEFNTNEQVPTMGEVTSQAPLRTKSARPRGVQTGRVSTQDTCYVLVTCSSGLPEMEQFK